MNIAGIHHHTGLGDHFNCCGMVRYFANLYQWQKFYVITKKKYADIVRYMYQNDENIAVAEIPNEPWNLEREFAINYFNSQNIPDYNRIIIGHQHYPWGSDVLKVKNPWEIFYDQVNLDYSVRQDWFVWPAPDVTIMPPLSQYAFIHEDASRGLLVDRSKISKHLKIIENPVMQNPFLLRGVFECASEIHCIDSSIKCLIDLIPRIDKNVKLYLHKVRDYAVGRTTNKWEIV